ARVGCETSLPVTRGTTRNVGHAAQSVFVLESRAERQLISKALPVHYNGFLTRGPRILHIESLIAGPQIFLGSTMAIQTPLHLQRCVLVGERHAIDRPVASVAADALICV